MAPLMSTIKKEIGLTKDQVYTSNILAVSATICARLLVGPLCDRFGPRKPMAFLLIVCALPLGCAALIQDEVGLYIVRTLIGFVGATFVPCQSWTTATFTGRIVGTANALAGGWGNLGGGVTQGLMVGFLAMFEAMGCSTDLAWRLSLVIPAVLWVITGILIFFLADDCPAGKWRDRPQTVPAKDAAPYSVVRGLKQVLSQPFTYLLVIGYACGFGVELYVDNTAAHYFEAKFSLDTTTAGLIASLFGLMNIFARALGGWTSDRVARKWFLRGRMYVIFVCVFFCGAFLCVLSAMEDLWAAILVLVIFSIFCQASCGAVYGLVPFANLEYGGMVSGFVGAGGNLGAMCWGFVHKAFGAHNKESTAYLTVGIVCMVGASMLFLGRLHGAAMLPCLGNDGQATEEELSRLKFDDPLESEDLESKGSKAEEIEEPLAFEDAYEAGDPTAIPYYGAAAVATPDTEEFVTGVYPPTPQLSAMSDFEPTGMPHGTLHSPQSY